MPSSGDLPDPGMEPLSLMSPVPAGRFFITSVTWEAQISYTYTYTPPFWISFPFKSPQSIEEEESSPSHAVGSH